MPKKKKKQPGLQASAPQGKAALAKKKDEDFFYGSAAVLVLSLFIIHPIAFGGYPNIQVVKFNVYFAIWTYSMLVIAFAAIVTKIQKPDFMKWRGIKAVARCIRPYEYALIGYWLVMFVSSCLAKYPDAAFGGVNSRGESLFLQTAYLLTVVVVARLYRVKERDILIFCSVASAVSLYGVCMFYGFDFLSFNATADIPFNVGPTFLFMSTMSNRIVAALYFCMAFCISLVMFSRCEGRIKWGYFANGCILFYALLVSGSRGAYVGILFAFALAFPFIAKTRRHAARFIFMMSACAALWWVFCKSYSVFGEALPFSVLVPYLPFLSLILAALGAFFFFAPLPAILRKAVVGGWFVLLAVVIVAGVAALPKIAEATGNETLSQASEILRGNFDKTFASNRFFVWGKALILASEKPLLGHGPDNFALIFTERYYDEAMEIEGATFDKAHNEYLQALVSVGALGLACLLAFYGLILWGMRKSSDDHLALAVAVAMICYLAQAFFEFSTPITHPLVWCMWGVLAGKVSNRKTGGQIVNS